MKIGLFVCGKVNSKEGDNLKITRVINNNVICAVNPRRQELILLGNGIGFQKKKGDPVDIEKIEKEFYLKSKNVAGKLYALLAQIPMEYMRVSESIIKTAKLELKAELNDNIYITLTDHISFAVTRNKNGVELKNGLLWEIKKFYASEYKVALKALDIINREFNVNLKEDEAGAIALHIINAELGYDMEGTVKITQFIQKILKIVRYYFKVDLDEDSLYYVRFITHLKFFAYRLFSTTNIPIENRDIDFQELIKSKYKEEYQCSLKIREQIRQVYGKELTDEDLIYLAVHIRRVTIN